MKKAQSIAMNTVIIAAIALVVLIVVVSIFINRMKPPVNALQACATYKGTCQTACDSTTTEYTDDGTDCAETNMKCCIPLMD